MEVVWLGPPLKAKSMVESAFERLKQSGQAVTLGRGWKVEEIGDQEAVTTEWYGDKPEAYGTLLYLQLEGHVRILTGPSSTTVLRPGDAAIFRDETIRIQYGPQEDRHVSMSVPRTLATEEVLQLLGS